MSKPSFEQALSNPVRGPLAVQQDRSLHEQTSTVKSLVVDKLLPSFEQKLGGCAPSLQPCEVLLSDCAVVQKGGPSASLRLTYIMLVIMFVIIAILLLIFV